MKNLVQIIPKAMESRNDSQSNKTKYKENGKDLQMLLIDR